MNYQKHYNALIERAKDRKLECYKEAHHVIPRCMGGNDLPENLVDLTAREHFIAHLLLLKIYPKQYGLIKAVNMMCAESSNQHRSMNRMYGWLRERLSKEMSRSQRGNGNSQFGTRWVHNNNKKQSKKIPKNDPLPEGWNEGRRIKFTEQQKILNTCKHCGNQFIFSSEKTFCTSTCQKTHYYEAAKGKIDANIEELVSAYNKRNSVTHILKLFGISNSGHAYLTQILRDKGYTCKNGGKRIKIKE